MSRPVTATSRRSEGRLTYVEKHSAFFAQWRLGLVPINQSATELQTLRIYITASLVPAIELVKNVFVLSKGSNASSPNATRT